MTTSRPGAVRPVPEHLRTVTPRLVVADGAAAIAFCTTAFGAQEIGERFTGPDGELIHAEIRIGDSVVMITGDAVDGPARSPQRLGGMVTWTLRPRRWPAGPRPSSTGSGRKHLPFWPWATHPGW